MCGISGFLKKNLPENKKQTLIKGLSALQAHRGPDFSGEWNNIANVHFFHQRLSLIDGNSRSNQPFFNDNLGFVEQINSWYWEIRMEFLNLIL